jgi:predicted NBD/HSP70 family sugar kinase
MRVLAIDIGGNSVKALVAGETEPRKFPSGPTLTPRQMVSAVRKLTEDWHYDVVSIGVPARVRDNHVISEPVNLGPGWVHFNFAKAFGLPVKIINDAAMQALGSYRSGKMLFLGLGTGLGSALIVDGNLMPMELGQLPYKAGTYESYLGLKGLERVGITKWREYVHQVVVKFISALELDDVVIGGGNVTKLDKLPAGCRAGDNAHAFRGGFLLWEKGGHRTTGECVTASSQSSRQK